MCMCRLMSSTTGYYRALCLALWLDHITPMIMSKWDQEVASFRSHPQAPTICVILAGEVWSSGTERVSSKTFIRSNISMVDWSQCTIINLCKEYYLLLNVKITMNVWNISIVKQSHLAGKETEKKSISISHIFLKECGCTKGESWKGKIHIDIFMIQLIDYKIDSQIQCKVCNHAKSFLIIRSK